jgi:hypothetical protein
MITHKPFSSKMPLLNSGEWTLLLLIFLTTSLLSFLLFHSYNYYLNSLITTITITLAIIFFLRKFSFEYWVQFFVIAVSGALGILIGSFLDFGSQALINLSSICGAGNSSGVTDVFTMILLAPWTHVGMWVGCSLALFIFQYCHQVSGNKHQKVRQHIYCFLGMIAGMWLIQKIPVNNLLPKSYSSATLWPVVQMWLGMSAGMFISLSFHKEILKS